MKRFGCVLMLALIAIPAWAAKKITVGELTDMLKSMHKENKSDADVSAALKQVELTEELTRSVMNNLVEFVPGQLSTEQIYVLEARSAFLAPPPSDIPTTAAPDAAGQKAILDKANTYVSSTYSQLPAISATKTTLRFQDNVEAVAPSSGMHSSATDVSVGSSFVNPFQFVHYINSTEATITSEHGAEKLPAEKDKTPWGANRMIALQEPDPSLGTIFAEAQATGSLKWTRWELINGKPAAVFSYDVPKKKSHLPINVCCFPSLDQTGSVHFTGQNGIGGPGGAPGAAGGAKGNLQTNTDWHNFKASGVPYHGEFFIDPDTGTVVRMITQAELKSSDVVHQDDTRIDYAPATLGDKSLVLPIKTVINTEVVPNGDSGAGRYSTRCTLFTTEYKNYQLAGAAAQK
jgi:hypothetical protein